MYTNKLEDWQIIREAESKGLMASMTGEVERVRTPLNETLSSYFRTKKPRFLGIIDEEDCEEALDFLNQHMEEKNIEKPKLRFPYSSGSDIFLVPVTENLQVKVLIEDEYYGDGEYSKYICIDFFLINEQTTQTDVDVLIKFIEKLF